MLSFIYRCDYEDAAKEEAEPSISALVLNVAVAVIAEKYDLSELATLALRKSASRAASQ